MNIAEILNELDRLDRKALHIIAESYDSVKVNNLVSFLRLAGV